MFGIDDPSAVAVLPTPEAAGTVGFWTEGNPGTGTPATLMRASFFNGLQQELLNILSAGGITPSKTTYNQLLAAIRASAPYIATDTGAANAAVVAYTPAVGALTDGMVYWFKAAAANTGATTLNVNGLGAKPVVGAAHSALQGGEIVANGKCQVVWSAILNSFVLVECTGGALQVSPAVQSNHALNLGQFVSSFGGSGYIKIPTTAGTLILQWGTSQTTASGANSPIFPIAFTSGVYEAFLTTQQSAVGSTMNLGWQAVGATSMNVYGTSAVAQIYNYLVIGK